MRILLSAGAVFAALSLSLPGIASANTPFFPLPVMNPAMIMAMTMLPAAPAPISYLVGYQGAGPFDPNLPTDVYIAAFGDNLGSLPLHAAATSAEISRDRYPERQRVIVGAVVWSRMDEAFLKLRGYRPLEPRAMTMTHLGNLTMDVLENELGRLSTITSVQLYGHSVAHRGIRLHEMQDRFLPDPEKLGWLTQAITPTGFVVLSGCNSGWLLARELAEVIHRPVFGTLTEDHYEGLASDGQWYYNSKRSFQIAGVTPAGKTDAMTENPVDCSGGWCVRMRTSNSLYRGHWGHLTHGQGFYRIFNREEDAQLASGALAQFTYTFPTNRALNSDSSLADRISSLADTMCPITQADPNGLRRSCTQFIRERGYERNPTKSFYGGPTVHCVNNDCGVVIKCGDSSCKTELNPDFENLPATDFGDQVALAVKGLQDGFLKE